MEKDNNEPKVAAALEVATAKQPEKEPLNMNLIAGIIGVVAVVGVLAVAVILNFREPSGITSQGDSSSSAIVTTADVNITEAGTYTLSGDYGGVYINTKGEVELILDSATITSEAGPAIYVEDADAVNIVLKGESTVTAKNTTEELEGVIHSTDDLIITGDGSLMVTGNNDGIVSKDALVIKSGIITVETGDDCIKGKDSVTISGGTFKLASTGGDGIKSTNEDDAKLGFVTITGGTFDIDVADDAIHAVTILTIDGGDFAISAHEGLEGTQVIVNGGNIDIVATDDGINANTKSSAYTSLIEINGGTINIAMGQGDTDAIDSNGDLKIAGGTINITAQSPFDYDGTATYTGGTLIVNGETVTTITNQFMGGPGGAPQEDPQGAPQGRQAVRGMMQRTR